MPFLLIFLGLMLIVAGWRGTQQDFYGLVLGDFTGTPNFLEVFAAIAVLGALGSIKTIRPIAGGLLVLVVLAMLISRKGFLGQLASQVKSASAQSNFTAPTAQDASNTKANIPTINVNQSGGSSGGGGGLFDGILGGSSGGSSDSTVSDISTVAEIAAFA